MDETGQPVSGGPEYSPPQPTYPPPQQPPAYPPYQAPMPAARPGRSPGRAWIIALAILAVFFVCVVVTCAWVGTFAGTGGKVITGDSIALIRIDGVIAGTGSSAVTPEDVLDQLKQANEDGSVKAILLRIDSPGGTVAASEEIATEVARARKPVIASIGDVGASGAYMVASQCDAIVASPGSTVGSIGVILEVANLQKLLDKLGVDFTVITAGEYKDIGSPYRSLTATETKLLEGQVDIYYGQFIDLVAKGRKMPPTKVRELATGFAWAGTEAKTLGLVDELGNYNDAIDTAARLGKISGEPEIVEYAQKSYFDVLNMLFGLSSKLDRIGAALETNSALSGPPVGR